jgi:thioester reductase-like protein
MKAREKYSSSFLLPSFLNHRFKLNVLIFRPGVISGSTLTGYSNQRDFTNLVIASCIKLKCFVSPSLFDFGWTPVDFVVRSIVTIARNKDCRIDCLSSAYVYHLVSRGPSVMGVITVLKELKFEMQEVTLREWRDRIENLLRSTDEFHSKDSFYAIIFKSLLHFNFEKSIQGTKNEKTKELLNYFGLDWPEITSDIIKSYVEQLLHEELIASYVK